MSDAIQDFAPKFPTELSFLARWRRLYSYLLLAAITLAALT